MRREQELGRRAVGQVRDGGRRDVAAPAVLERHGDAQRHAQVAGLPGLRQAAELADLEVDHVHRPVGVAAQQHVEAVDDLVEHERMIACAGGRPGTPRRSGTAARCRRRRRAPPRTTRIASCMQPAGVGVGDEPVARLQHRRRRRGCARCRRRDRRRP